MFKLLMIFILSFGAYATTQIDKTTVSSGQAITASKMEEIIDATNKVQHPMGYHKPTQAQIDSGTYCKTGWDFLKMTSDGFGLCSKLFDAASDSKTSFGNMINCVNNGGKILGFFEIQSMMNYDLEKWKVTASHTTGWKKYADGYRLTSVQGAPTENGFTGVNIHPGQVCTQDASGPCYTGDMNWDWSDRIDDVESTGRVMCGY